MPERRRARAGRPARARRVARPDTDALDKRATERIVFDMSAQSSRRRRGMTRLTAASSEPEQPEPENGAVEFDERRAKLERLRAEGIDPYPPVSLWDDAHADRGRARRARPGHARARRAPRAQLPDRRPADLPPRARQDGVPRRSRPVRLDPGGRARGRARTGDIRPHARPRHRRHRRRSRAASTSPSAASWRWP